MSQYTLSLKINTSDFPELGNPLSPNKETAKKVPKAHRDDYKGYMQSCDIGMGEALYRVHDNVRQGSACQSEEDVNSIKINLPYDTETGKTYKFLGMDIDEDFNAVIKIGEGHVVVDSMFNRTRMDSLIQKTNYRHSGLDEEWTEKMLLQINDTVKDTVIRKIATSMKTGVTYSAIKEWDPDKATDYEHFFSTYVDNIRQEIKGDDDSASIGGGSLYSSIILNLVNAEELEKLSIKGNTLGQDEDSEKKIVELYLSTLFTYWSQVSKVYSGWITELAAFDIWSDLNKKVIGEGEFNRRFSKCVDITDNNTGEVVGNMVSFAGVSRNGGVVDQNIVRDQGAVNLEHFSDTLNRGRNYSDNSPQDMLKYVLLSMVDDEDIEDVYSLSDEEAQALSALDSLRYIDEEAAMSRASYNMNDPDERGLFVKSAIRSYERNFREFKPADNYDVTTALAELVERGDIESNQVVSQEILATKSEDEVGDIVTLSGESVKVKADVQSLKKVMKMVNKFSKDILSQI